MLQAGGFGLVVLDLARVSRRSAIKRLPFTTWLRLHRIIEGSETACVLIGSGTDCAQRGWGQCAPGEAQPAPKPGAT